MTRPGTNLSRWGWDGRSIIRTSAHGDAPFLEWCGDHGETRGSGRPHLPGSRNEASVPSPLLSRALLLRYSDPGDLVVDSFTGGSVRPLMTARYGRRYRGVELRGDQVKVTQDRISERGLGHLAEVVEHDSRRYEWDDLRGQASLLLTCPPYHDLERYSNKSEDLSNQPSYDGFLEALGQVFEKVRVALRPGAHACIVVGGLYDTASEQVRDLPGDTQRLLEACGFTPLGQVVHLRNGGGAAAQRVGNFERTGRPIVAHEQVVVARRGS